MNNGASPPGTLKTSTECPCGCLTCLSQSFFQLVFSWKESPWLLYLEASILWGPYYLHEPSALCFNSPSHTSLCASSSRNSSLEKTVGGVRHNQVVTFQVSQHQSLGKKKWPSWSHEVGQPSKRQGGLPYVFLLYQNTTLHLRTSDPCVIEPEGSWENRGGTEYKGGFWKDPPFHELFLQNTTHCFTSCKTLFNHYR